MPTFYEATDIDEAYLKPLRSVLLIDDQFPRYEQLMSGGPEKANFDIETAGKLVALCRERGLMCDVENRAADLTDERMDHLGKSDLVVLDYHLEPKKGENPEQALRILRHLAESHHANLVVVFTNSQDLEAVRRQIAGSLRGDVPQADFPEEYRDVLNTWEPAADAAVVDLYLKGDDDWKRSVKGLRAELSAKTIPKERHTEIISIAIEDHIRAISGGLGDRKLCTVNLSPTGEPHRWVQCHNVFIAIAAKRGETDPIDELRDCILAWSPPPLQLLLAHARNLLERGGFNYERVVLGEKNIHVGWIYHATRGDEAELGVRIKQLLDRLFSGLQKQLTASLSSQATNLFSRLTRSAVDTDLQHQQGTLARAYQLAGYSESVDHQSILHALNSFLCSEPYSGHHLRPGTVFCTDTANQLAKWWVCVAPACDMIPRETKDEKSWKFDLAPFFPVDVLRLEIETNGAGALQNATRCRHLFVERDAARITLRIVDDLTRLPRAETLFVPDRGQTVAAKFAAYRIHSTATSTTPVTAPLFERIDCVAVAQLRPSYADRVLQEAGFQGSRVGVDFVDMSLSSSERVAVAKS